MSRHSVRSTEKRAGNGRGPETSRRRLRPTLMALEDRQLLSTFTVNNPTDTPVVGQIDLRQAIGHGEFEPGGRHDRL